MLTNVEKLLLKLLKIPSETGYELAVLMFLENKIQELIPQIQIIRIPVDKKRYNLLCSFESIHEIKKLFVAHIDTVPGQLEISYDERNIYGRGACDNKQSVAAMIIALHNLINKGEKNLGILITVGEEATFDGAQAAQEFFKKENIAPELVIIGEPTQGQIVTAQKGIYAIKISCHGKQEHSSSTNINSAIHKLVIILNYIQNNFDHKNSIFNISLIQGGVAENIVAGEANATIVWRTDEVNFAQRVTQFIDAMPDEINKNLEQRNHLNITIQNQLKINADDFSVEELKVIQSKKTNLPQFKKHEVNYFTEMYFFENSIVCGAGDIHNAHTKNEQISRKELNEIVDIYISLVS